MAYVADKTKTAVLIDHYLGYLWSEWNAVPQVAEDWDTWTEYERLDFVLEWPIREDRLGFLRRWSDHGKMTEEQRLQFNNLLTVISRNRPTIDRLLAE
jgi:hypothetical protein